MIKTLKSMVELKECLKIPSPKLKIPVYTEDKDEDKPVHKPKEKRLTLNQRMDRLETSMDRRMNRIEESIINLTKEMRSGFKEVNYRIDNIEKRLDYNNLKDLPR